MKKFFKFATLAMTAILAIGFTSCGDKGKSGENDESKKKDNKDAIDEYFSSIKTSSKDETDGVDIKVEKTSPVPVDTKSGDDKKGEKAAKSPLSAEQNRKIEAEVAVIQRSLPLAQDGFEISTVSYNRSTAELVMNCRFTIDLPDFTPEEKRIFDSEFKRSYYQTLDPELLSLMREGLVIRVNIKSNTGKVITRLKL